MSYSNTNNVHPVHMTYADIAQQYNWGRIIPLPQGQKFPPPSGFTGEAGADRMITEEDRAQWDRRVCNVAMVLPDGVMALDVDTYNDKHGDVSLAEMQVELGSLPPTVMSTSRGNPYESGHWFYRYPGGKLAGKIGQSIDILQATHRYAVAWPSVISNNDGTSRIYVWFDKDGNEMTGPPALEDIAELPTAWVEHLKSGATEYRGKRASAATTASFSAEIEDDDRGMCPATRRTLERALAEFEDLTRGSHHDTMLASVLAVTSNCAGKGHPGYNEAIATLEEAWNGATGREGGEFERMVEGALSKVADEREGDYTQTKCTEDECGGMIHMRESTEKALASLGITMKEKIVPSRPYGSDEDEVEEYVTDLAANSGDGHDDGGNGGNNDTVAETESEEEDMSWVNELESVKKFNSSGDLIAEKVAPTYANTAIIMRNDTVLRGLGINEMGGGLAWRVLPPWRKDAPGAYDAQNRSVSNSDLDKVIFRIRAYFGGEHKSLPREACDEAISLYANSNAFSPWRDHINSLPAWDGVDRLSTAIPEPFVESTEYTRRAFRNWYLGMMDRAYNPGCQMDSMLVLTGGQGLYKTSWFQAIVPSAHLFVDLEQIPDPSAQSKDALGRAHAGALVGFDEINKMSSSKNQNELKAFLTQKGDKWRPPYARVDEDRARHFVCWGTTNEEEFLLDTTGNRRYWPIQVLQRLDPEYLSREYHDLLLAEARDRYLGGERLDYSDDFEALANAARENNLADPVGDAVFSWLDNPVNTCPWLQNLPPKIRVDRVSIPMIMKFAPELSKYDATKDRDIVTSVMNALDRHPEYNRMHNVTNPVRVGDGSRNRKVWERVAPAAWSGATTP